MVERKGMECKGIENHVTCTNSEISSGKLKLLFKSKSWNRCILGQ